jgi:hypothetical protein
MNASHPRLLLLAFGVSAVTVLSQASSAVPATTSPTLRPHAVVNDASGPLPVDSASLGLARLSADFVENRGQWDGPARFVAWKGATVASFENAAIRLRTGKDRSSSMILAFEGAVNKDAQLLGENKRSGYYNFFLGNDATRWRSNVPAYSGVLYRELYDGVDVRVREEEGRLEYDVLLLPGADLEQVVIRADGASRLTLGSDGSLVLESPAGSVQQTPPRTWEVLASGDKRPKASRFRIIDAHRFGFEVPDHDSRLALVIDPGLEWSTFLGGSNREEIHGLALTRDGSGDVVVAGHTWSSDFPTAPAGSLGASPLIPFVARLNSTGTALVYATLFGGTNGNVSFAFGLTLDATSAPIVVGETNAANFPTTPGAFQPTFNEPSATINRGWDGFVTRFNSSGSAMVFSTFLGAAPIFDPSLPGSARGGYESARSVVLDGTDSVILAGVTTSEDFPTTPGAYDRSLATLTVPVTNPDGTIESRVDAFIARLSPGGTQLTYSTYLGGQSDDIVRDMVIDPQGVLTLVGTEAPLETFDAQGNRTDHGIPFPTTPDAIARTHLGASDTFVARLRLDGTGTSDLKYGTILGGTYIDEASAIALDPNDPEMITICGNNRSWDFPTTSGAWRRAPVFLADGHPYYSGYLMRFRFPATGGGSLVWSTLITDRATGQFADSVVVDPSGDVILVGSDIAAPGLPTTERSYRRLPPKGSFLLRFSGDGGTLLHSTFLHKPSGVLVLRMKAVSTGPHAVIVAGSTLFPDHPTTPGAFDRVFGSDGTGDGFHTYDGFVSKMTLDPDPTADTTAATPALVSPADGATIPLNGPLTLDWTDVADASGVQLYEVEVSANAAFLTGFTFWNLAAGSFPTSQAAGSTSQEGVHYWRVRTLDGVNNFSPWSEVRKFTVGAPTWTNFAASVLTPNGGVGGSTVQGQVHIQNVAPAGGQVYTLTSSNPSVASVPASVTVPAGASSATFTVTTHNVSVSTPVQITVWSEGNGDHPVLWVDPPTPGAVTLSALALNPGSVTGGAPSTGTATLSAAAPPGGQVVTLSSSNAAVATVPPSVTVVGGSTSATFGVSTVAVGASTNVTITGTSGGTTRTAVLTVSPSGGGPGFRSPTANAADSGGDGNGFESTPSSAHGDDAASAMDNNGGTSSSTSCTSASRDKHRFFNYGISVPAGTGIPGIEVRLDARVDSGSNSPRMCVQLSWNGGASWTAAKSTPTLTTTMTTYVLGGPADTWGRTWTPAELTDANFRVRVINAANSTNRDFLLDWVAVRVHESGPPATDTTPPTVSITSPAAGATVSGTVTLAASAADNVGVSRVEFLVDAVLLATDTTAPYSVSWNTTTATNAAHSLMARAFDAANNQATSAAVSVTVNNAPPPVLDITLSGVPPSIRRGQFFTATGTVSNTGSTTATGHTVLISFTPSDSLRLENPQSSSQSVAPVEAGTTENVAWSIRAERTASATLTMTLRNASGATVDTVSQVITITD